VGYSLAALCGVVLSAIRTGGLFFILETLLLKKYGIDPIVSNIISALAAIMALGTFELYLVFDGYSKGKKKNQITSSRIGMIVSFAVILVAGLFSSFILVDTIPKDWQTVIDIVVAIITGCGAGVITYFGGENIGFSFTDFENKKKKIFSDYQDEYLAWRESAVKSYKTSQFNFHRKGGSTFAPPVQIPVQFEQKFEQGVQNQLNNGKKIPLYEKIRQSIEQYVNEKMILPNVNEFALANGFTKAYVSIGLNEYIYKNRVWLLENNITNNERVIQASQSLEKAKPGSVNFDEDGWPVQESQD